MKNDDLIEAFLNVISEIGASKNDGVYLSYRSDYFRIALKLRNLLDDFDGGRSDIWRDDRLLPLADVLKLCGKIINKTSVYELEKKGDFPARVMSPGKLAGAWRESEVKAWINDQKKSDNNDVDGFAEELSKTFMESVTHNEK